jgi:hypothetical protein
MLAIDVQEHARKLHDAYGEKATVEAAQKARAAEARGEREEAQTWRRIEAALRQMQGPHAS